MYHTVFCTPENLLALVLEEKAFHFSPVPAVLMEGLTYYYVQCFYCQGRTKNLESGLLRLYFHINSIVNFLIIQLKCSSVQEIPYIIDISSE